MGAPGLCENKSRKALGKRFRYRVDLARSENRSKNCYYSPYISEIKGKTPPSDEKFCKRYDLVI